MRLKPSYPLIAALLLGGCAGSSSNLSAREYRRAEADSVRLKKLEVVVVVAGPPRVVEDRLDVQGFPPPELDAPLSVGAHEADTERALVAWLKDRLRAQGFEATIHAKNQPTVEAAVVTSMSPSSCRPEAGAPYRKRPSTLSSTGTSGLMAFSLEVMENSIRSGR